VEPSALDDVHTEPAFGATAGPVVPDVRRVVVLRANSIGDFVLSLPALAALRAAYPQAEITYLGDCWHQHLLDGRPGPWDRVDVVPFYPGVRGDDPATRDTAEVLEFFAAQRVRGYDLAVQIHGGGANSNPFVRALGARVTVGLRDRGAAPLDRWVPYARYQHEVHRFLEVAGLVGAPPVGLEPKLQVTRADHEAAARVMPQTAAHVVAIHPGANDARRRWPTASFAAVADALAGRGAKVVLIGNGAADSAAAGAIVEAAKHPPVDLVGLLTLSATMGLLDRCRLTVANDSGPRHLASAIGIPTVGIYWWKNLLNTGPLSAAGHRVAVSFRATCPVCGADQVDDRCAHDPSFVDDVPVDEVVAAAFDLYAQAMDDVMPAACASG
jgi:ADP-heptose:LPS heptosyltransferase